jgi:hypothetical protein
MANVRRTLPFVLLLVGVVLISLGLTRALGITLYGYRRGGAAAGQACQRPEPNIEGQIGPVAGRAVEGTRAGRSRYVWRC